MLTKLCSWKSVWKGALFLVIGTVLIAIYVVGSNVWIHQIAAAHVFHEIDKLPTNDVGLVLGTAPTSLHFRNRVAAAAKLYHAGKVKHLLLSGDNSRPDYNEPEQMRRSLLALGVDKEALVLDYAGFRTLDSILRAKEVFDLSRFTIITDEFHTYRAVFTAVEHGLDVVAFPSAEVPVDMSLRSRLREYAANSWAMLDIYLLNTGPKYTGKREAIPPVALQIP